MASTTDPALFDMGVTSTLDVASFPPLVHSPLALGPPGVTTAPPEPTASSRRGREKLTEERIARLEEHLETSLGMVDTLTKHVGTIQTEVRALRQGMDTLVEHFTSVAPVQPLPRPETRPRECQTCLQDPKVGHKCFRLGKDRAWCAYCDKRNRDCVPVPRRDWARANEVIRLKTRARRSRKRQDIVAASKAALRYAKRVRTSKIVAKHESGPYAPVVDELWALHQQFRLNNQLKCHRLNMPLTTPNEYDNPCSDFSEDDRTDDSDEFGGIDSSEDDGAAGAAVARPAKTPTPMPRYRKPVHGPNYRGPRSPTPPNDLADDPTPPPSKRKKTSRQATVGSASGSPAPRRPGTRARPQSPGSGQANAKARK